MYWIWFTDDIIQKIQEAGFEIAMTKEVELSKEEAEEFYSEHKDEEYFDSLTSHMSRLVHTYVDAYVYGN